MSVEIPNLNDFYKTLDQVPCGRVLSTVFNRLTLDTLTEKLFVENNEGLLSVGAEATLTRFTGDFLLEDESLNAWLMYKKGIAALQVSYYWTVGRVFDEPIQDQLLCYYAETGDPNHSLIDPLDFNQPEGNLLTLDRWGFGIYELSPYYQSDPDIDPRRISIGNSIRTAITQESMKCFTFKKARPAMSICGIAD